MAACGNIDNDEVLDVWTINDARMLNNVVPDTRLKRWAQLKPRKNLRQKLRELF